MINLKATKEKVLYTKIGLFKNELTIQNIIYEHYIFITCIYVQYIIYSSEN